MIIKKRNLKSVLFSAQPLQADYISMWLKQSFSDFCDYFRLQLKKRIMKPKTWLSPQLGETKKDWEELPPLQFITLMNFRRNNPISICFQTGRIFQDQSLPFRETARQNRWSLIVTKEASCKQQKVLGAEWIFDAKTGGNNGLKRFS